MAVDQVKLLELLNEATFRFEPWKGSINDFSVNQRPMQFQGNPVFDRRGEVTYLCQRAANDGAQSVGAHPAIVDITAPFTIETRFVQRLDAADMMLLRQQNAAGGLRCYVDVTNGRVVVDLYDGVGAIAHTFRTPNGSIEPNIEYHVVHRLDYSTPVSDSLINGIPLASNDTVTAAPVNCGNEVIDVAGANGAGGGSIGDAGFCRVQGSWLTDSERLLLYHASQELVSPC